MAVVIGDIRNELERDLRKRLAFVLSRKLDLKKYYVLVYAKWQGGDELITKIITMLHRPPKMIGTVCYAVDNERGIVRQLWCLPKDFPVPENILDPDSVNAKIHHYAQGMPIVY